MNGNLLGLRPVFNPMADDYSTLLTVILPRQLNGASSTEPRINVVKDA